MVTTDRRQGVNSGAAVKVPCRVATTAAITLSGLQTVDGIALAAGDRVLVKNQASGVNNGVYEASTSTWTRALDFDGAFDAKKGTLVFVTSGSSNANKFFTVSTADPITIGTTSLSFSLIPVEINAGVSVMEYGATGDGVTDDSAAIQAALSSGASLVLLPKPASTYLIRSTLTIPQQVVMEGVGLASITKGANIDMVNMTAIGCGMTNISLLGAGATYTGRGIYITGNYDQYITRVNVYDMNGYCLEFTVADAGQRFQALQCEFYRTTAANYAIKMPTAAESNGNRKFVLCTGTGGASFMEAAGSASTQIISCAYGTNGVLFTTDTARMVMNGTRAAITATMAIKGTSHTIVGNSIANNITIDSACTAMTLGPNNALSGGVTIVDNSVATTTNMNEIHGEEATFTPVWKGAGGDPAIGNGTISGTYFRNGRIVTVNIDVVMGSTTSYGTGEWYFNLPAPLNHAVRWNAVGSVYILDSATAHFVGSCKAQGGGIVPAIYCYSPNVASAFTSAVPITWATGDELRLTITYVLG